MFLNSIIIFYTQCLRIGTYVVYYVVNATFTNVFLLAIFVTSISVYAVFFSHSIRTYGGGMIPYLKFNILGDYNFDEELVL